MGTRNTINKGKILLVGFGPGDAEHMTQRARSAILEADVVIGYSTYIRLVEDLLEGKQVIRKGMTEEIDRCEEAWRLACEGKVVALVSSGDAGVYGMAGPTYEVLLTAGWTPESQVEVEVVPGATALNACAALLGAPLTHDFCAISLSDLLTPWPVIRKRLQAVAAADFVVALYNPKSGRRTGQIVEAQRILLQYRAPQTPVGIVKSAYRKRQNIELTTLADMADCEIGMLSTVIIGNSSSFAREGLLITPRGYSNKYTAGEVREGERAGRSLQMGLDGWQGCLHAWLRRQDITPTWEAMCQQFEMPLGEILAAFTGGADDLPYAQRVPEERKPSLPQAFGRWGQVRVVVRNHGGISECLLTTDDEWRLQGDWLHCTNAHFHLHLRWHEVSEIWFARRTERSRGVHCLNQHGDVVFRVLLTEASDHQAFAVDWQALTAD